MKQGEWYEIKYDADGNVRKVVDIDFSVASDKYENTVAQVEDVVKNNDTVLLADTTTVNRLEFKNGTLYTSTIDNRGFSVSPDVKVVLALADKTGSEFDDVTDGYTGYNGLQKALRDLNANAAGFTLGSVEVSAILESGVATSIVINDTNASGSTTTPVIPGTTDSMGVTVDDKSLLVTAKFLDDGVGGITAAQRVAIANALANAGVSVQALDPNLTYAIGTDGKFYTIVISEYYSITVDGTVTEYVSNSGTAKNTKAINLATADGTNYKQTMGASVTYPSNSNIAADSLTITGHTVIETGYVAAPTAGTLVTLPSGLASHVKVGSSIDVTVTVAADGGNTTGKTVSIATANANSATVSATQTLTPAEAVAGKTLTFTVSNITAATGNINATATAIAATYDVSDPTVTVTNANGLAVTAYANKTTGVDDEVVTVTVEISGVASGNAKLTLTGPSVDNIAWQASVADITGLSRHSDTELYIASGANFNVPVTVKCSFQINADDADDFTITVDNQ